MTTENNFTAATETLKENAAKATKWMQDANAKLMEIQKQQIKTVADFFNKNTSVSQFGAANKFNNPFGESTKAITDLFQKNMETVTNLLKTTLKPVTDFSKFSDKEALTNEMKKQFETLNQQVADLALVNQTNLDTILKQFDTTTKTFTPLNEQYKKEIEKTVEASKETMQSIIDSYSNLAAPSMEANKETFEKMNEQIKTSINANMKFWSDLLNNQTNATVAKPTTEKKADVVKIIAAPTTKKQATANVSHN